MKAEQFILEVRSLEDAQDDLTTSDLQGCVSSLSAKSGVDEDLILSYIYGHINFDTLMGGFE